MAHLMLLKVIRYNYTLFKWLLSELKKDPTLDIKQQWCEPNWCVNNI